MSADGVVDAVPPECQFGSTANGRLPGLAGRILMA
jgi:hypothetical protein